MANRKISWDKQAIKQFNRAILFIAEDSIQNAENVRTEILVRIADIINHPESHALDKYKTNNDGNYPACELHRLRIAYYVLPRCYQDIKDKTYQQRAIDVLMTGTST